MLCRDRAALCADDFEPINFERILQLLEESVDSSKTTDTMPPLFDSRAEYDEFTARHNASAPPSVNIAEYCGDAYLGIDAGSTTTKAVLITPDGGLLYTYYGSNKGNPVSIILNSSARYMTDAATA